MYFNTVTLQNLKTSLLCLLLHHYSLWLKYWLWYNRERPESFRGSVCAILQDTQNGKTQWQLQKSFRLPTLLFFPLKYPQLYLTLHNKRWSACTVAVGVGRKPAPVHVPPVSVGAGRAARSSMAWEPRRYLGHHLEEAAARLCSMNWEPAVQCLCAVLQQPSSAILIQFSFPAWKMKIKSAHIFTMCFQAPTPAAS